MTRTPLLLALAATAALAGCNNNDDHTIVAGPDGTEESGANDMNLANVQLPPSITASKIYRCKDNSVIYVDWLSDGTARVRTDRNEVGTGVQVGEGQPLQGSADAPAVSYNGQSCKS